MSGLSLDVDSLALGFIWYVIFLLSTTCHEACHALAAKWGGDPTAFHYGQASLNPLPHIAREPFGMVVMPALSYFFSGWMFGWASAPYDPSWQRRHPRRAAWMSLAGPAANFALFAAAAVALRAGLWSGVFQPPERIGFARLVAASSAGFAEGVAVFLSILFSLNLLLGVFNLIPIPPLDGFSALGIALPERTALRLEDWRASLGPYAFLGILVAWRLFDGVFGRVFLSAVMILYGGAGDG